MNTKSKCGEKLPCLYRQGGFCTFWEQAEQIPSVWAKVFPADDLDLLVTDTFREPCLKQYEDREAACRGILRVGEKGWIECEDCNDYTCRYVGHPLEVGDVLNHFRHEEKL